MIDHRRVPDLWRRCHVTVRDLPFALLLASLAFLPTFQGRGTQLGDMPGRGYDELAVLAVLLQCLPLALRRRWTTVCVALVSLGFAIDQIRGYHSLAGTALPIALVSTSAYLERHRRATIAGLSAAYLALAVVLNRMGSSEKLEGFLVIYATMAAAWVVGSWLRATRAAEAERRRRVAEDTRTAERTRIARELHDVVTHHVTAMVVQSEAARYLTAAPDRLDETLTAVTDTGRRAISDLRHLLDLLNPDNGTDPAVPSVGELGTLVEQTRQAGQPVEFTEEGERAKSAGSAEFVTYRVVQEALTNALKYAHGSRTVALVRYGERDITVEVSTDGSGSRTASPGGSGRGLTGLRERVDALGGEFSADRRTGGGFVVRARIPGGSRS
ncbi:two-component sensor histidine kinase [Actinomadura darangshiensis]|uniref:histidine kinase n=1 Tax=Actinomadura darangshiensis TaxID=705336 RepID=A0A4R5BQ27_9ACTN|nr:histidine kinase [Actinomadura darangshiensis]TDD87493.1 two-component sensor histidine kinase [Actinomadura darangshiensis]